MRFFAFGLLVLFFSGCAPKLNKFEIGPKETVWQFSKGGTNVFIVEHANALLMIDTGNPGDGDKFVAKFQKENIDISKIDAIILTHAHGDHAGNADYFSKICNAPIIVGSEDKTEFLKGENGKICPVSLQSRILKPFVRKKFEPIDSFEVIVRSRYFKEWSCMISPMPGHTPGSLIIEFDNYIFVGDLIRGSATSHDNPKRHYYMCDIEDNNEDINAILTKEKKLWFTGHFGPLEIRDVEEFMQKL